MKIDEVNSLKDHTNELDSDVLIQFVHELRSPLHCVLSFTDSILRKSESVSRDRMVSYLKEVNKSGMQCLTLVNEMMEMKKNSVKSNNFNIKKADISAILKRVVNQMKSVIDDKKISISWDCPDEVFMAKVDEKMLTRVVINLLSNALKFTPENKKISINVEKINSFTEVMVTISDEGVGICEEELEIIFEEYRMGSNVESDGLGLGLSICKNIINAHNGKVWAENNENGGASIKFIVPLVVIESDLEITK